MSTLRVDMITDGTNSVPSDTVIKGTGKAWVNFNGSGVVAVRGSFNTSTITDNGVGDYTQNFSTSLLDANFISVATASDTEPRTVHINTRASSSVRLRTGAGSWGVFDSPEAHFFVVR